MVSFGAAIFIFSMYQITDIILTQNRAFAGMFLSIKLLVFIYTGEALFGVGLLIWFAYKWWIQTEKT